MAAIVTALVGTCSNHRSATVTMDGVPITLRLGDAELNTALSAEEFEQFVRLAARRQRVNGVALTNFLNCCLLGDEASNVKMYTLFGPGAALTKTNIGTSYVNIPVGLNGERVLADLTGCTQYRFFLNANLVGLGAFGVRCIRDNDSAVLYENTNIGAAGEREIDTDWQALPAAFLAQGLTLLRVQGKSVTAADDPLFRRCLVGFR